MSFARHFFMFAAVVFVISVLLSLRASVHGSKAAEFAPLAYRTTLGPSRTEVHAVLPFGIAESSKSGDPVVALVSAPVWINDEIAVPTGAKVTGTIARIEEREGKASVLLEFSQLVVGQRATDIQADPVSTTAPVDTDIDVLGEAFGVATRAAVAVGIGASSNNGREVGRSAAIGTALAMAAPSPNAVPLTVVLTHPVNMRT